MDKELLYDSYGRPTELNEKISLRSLEMAKEILDGGYVTRVYVSYHNSGTAVIHVIFNGKLTSRGANPKKVLPFKVKPDANGLQKTLIEWAMDEVEMELGRRLTGWTDRTITTTRLNLERTKGYVLDTFKVKHVKGLK